MADTDIIVRIVQQIVADAGGAQVAGKTVREALLAEQKKLVSGLQGVGQTGSASELESELARLEQISTRAQAAITAASTGSQTPGAVRSRIATALIPPGEEGVTPEIAGARKELAKDLKSIPIDDLKARLNEFAGAISSTSAKIAAARDPITQARTSVQRSQDSAAALMELEEGGPLANATQRTALARLEAETLQELIKRENGLAEAYVDAQATIRRINAQLEARTLKRLAADGKYTTALAKGAIAQAEIEANLKGRLAINDRYTKALAGAAQAQATINAKKNEELAKTTAYGETLARSTIAQAKINADQQRVLAGSGRYADELARSTLFQAQINANTQERLAAGKRYSVELARAAVAQATINADKLEDLATGQRYASELARAAVAQSLINAAKNEELASSQSYVASLARSTAAQAASNNQKQAILAQDSFYIKTLAQTTASQASINRQKQEELAVNTTYIADLAKTKATQAQINVAKLRELQALPGYVANLAEADIIQQQINLAKKAELQRLGQAALNLESQRQGRSLSAEQDRLFTSNTVEGAAARTAFSDESLSSAKRKATEAKLLASNDELIKAQAEETANTKLATAKRQQMLLVQSEYIEAQRVEAANTLRSAAIKAKAALTAASSPAGVADRLGAAESQGLLASQALVEKKFQRVAELQSLLGIDKVQRQALLEQTEAAVLRGNLLDQLNVLTKEEVALQRRAAALQARAGIDRRHQAFKPDAALAESGGIGFAQGFRSTLRFGVASTAIYGLARGISEAVREATELDKIFNQIERQFKSQFDGAEAAAQFALFKAEVFEIAELTGQAADEVANVGFQLQGAFGGDTIKAINETKDAIIAARVTGLEVGEVIDSFTALTQSFADSDLKIQRISDSALQLQEDLGVLAKETITFAADLAPLGAELGFTAEKLSAIGAVAQQTSGRSGTALAEAFGRVLPQIQENAVDIINIFKTLGPDVANQVRNAFKSNDINQVFDLLLQNFNRFDQGARNALVETLGGRREAQSIIGVLSNGPKVFQEYQRALDSSGKTTEYFNDLQDTLQQRLAVLGEEFKRLVQTLFESGLKDFFVDFINLLETTVRLFETLIGVASALGGIIGPLSGPLALLAQGLLITRGAGALRGGVQKLTGSAGAAATGGAHLRQPSGGLLSRAGAQGAASGAATGSAFAQRFGGKFNAGFLGSIPVGGLALAAGAIYFSSVDAKVREEAEKAASELGAKFNSFDLSTEEGLSGLDEQFNTISQDLGLGIGASRDRIERALREGKSVEQLSNSLGEIATRNASTYQQILDGLPGDLSQDIEVLQAKASEAVKFVYENIVREGFLAGLSNLDDSGAERFKSNITKQLTDALTLTDDDVSRFVNESNVREVSESAKSELVAALQRGLDQGLGDTQFSTFASRELNQLDPNAQDTLARNYEIDESSSETLAEVLTGLNEAGIKQAEEILELLEGAETTADIVGIAGEIQRRTNEEGDFPDIASILAPALQGIIDDGNIIIANQEAAAEAIKSLEQAQAEFEAGSLSASGLIQQQQGALVELKNLDDLTGYFELLAETRELVFDRLSNELDSLENLADLSGVDQTGLISSRINEILADTNNNLSIDQEADFAMRLVEAVRAQRQAEAEFIEDEAERARFLAANITNLVGEEAREALLAQLISANTEFIDALSALVGDDQQKIDATVKEIARVVIETGVSVEEAAKTVELARQRAALLIRQTQDYLRLYEERATAILAAGDDAFAVAVADFNLGVSKAFLKGQQDRELRELEANAETSAAELAALAKTTPSLGISGPGSPGDVAKAEADEAERLAEEARRAEEERQRYLAELRQAKDDYTLALVENNPVKAAEVGLFTSTAAIGRAKNEAERYAALAERVRADRSLKEAMFDIQASQLELLIAITDAAGETIESAELQIEAIKQRLYFAKTQNLGDAAYNRLKAELVGAEAALRDATLAERRESFQFLADMGKITQGQLINYLQSLLAIPDLTEKQIQDIQREIYGLRQQLGQDFQFNLPSNLALPTLYEARRFDQSGISGGYNDNRVITVTVNAETGASPEAIATAVATAVGDPTRSGTAVRKY